MRSRGRSTDWGDPGKEPRLKEIERLQPRIDCKLCGSRRLDVQLSCQVDGLTDRNGSPSGSIGGRHASKRKGHAPAHERGMLERGSPWRRTRLPCTAARRDPAPSPHAPPPMPPQAPLERGTAYNLKP
eukprot:37692-Prorocentrum_minimum.AAC.2